MTFKPMQLLFNKPNIQIQLTIIMDILAPPCRCFSMTSFKRIISDNFTVKSSSLLRSRK